MRITTVKSNESDLSALAHRLYPNLNENGRKRVEMALLKANPHLAEANAFKPGILVRLPDLPDVTLKPGSASDDPVAGVMEQLSEALQEYQAILLQGSKERREELDNQEQILKRGEVAEAIKKSPEATELAKNLKTSLHDEKKMLDEEMKTREALFKRIAEDLATLLD